MNRKAEQTLRLPAEADVFLALGTLLVPIPLLMQQLGLLRQPSHVLPATLVGMAVMATAGTLVLCRSSRAGSLRLIPVLDRMLEIGLLSILVVIPIAYSIRFSTTLILKETLAQTVVVFLVAVWLARALVRGELAYVKTPYNAAIGGLLIYAAISLAWTQPKGTSIRDLLLFVSFWFLFHLYCLAMRRPAFRRKALLCATAAGGIVAFISLGQLYHWEVLTGTPFAEVWAPGQDPRLKVASTIGHNISVATYFMGLAYIQLGWVLTSPKRPQVVVALALFGLSCFIMFASETRGVYVAFPFSLLVMGALLLLFRGQRHGAGWMAARREAWRRLVLMLLVIGLGISLFGAHAVKGKRIDPIQRISDLRPSVQVPGTRVRLWTISLDMIRDHPLRGLGFEAFKFHYPMYQARYFAEHPDTRMQPTDRHTDRVHNDYLQVWVELGVMGLVLTFTILVVHTIFMWRQTRNAADSTREARDDLFRTVLFAGILGAMADAVFSFYAHVASDALMLILLLSTAVALSRPLRLRTLRLPGYARRPRLMRALGICLIPIAVSLSVFGPAVVAPFIPFESCIGASRGPVAHALADAIATPEERSLSWQLQRLSTLQLVARDPKPDSLVEIRRHLPRLEETAAAFVKSRDISGYRGQASYYAGQTYARLGEVYGQLAPLEERIGWSEVAERSRKQSLESFQQAREHLRRATEEYQFRHIYYELAKADYYLAAQQRDRNPGRSKELMDEAEVSFRMAAGIYPPHLDYHHDLAKFLLTVRKDFAGALEAWRRAYRIDPGFVDSRLLAEAELREKSPHTELPEGLYRAAFELGREYLGLHGELKYGARLSKFYSFKGMPDRAVQVALEIDRRHPDRSEAFWLAAQHLGTWGRMEELERLIFDELEKRPLDPPYYERCLLIDEVYRYRKEYGELIRFWEAVAAAPAEPEVAPRVEAQLGSRRLALSGDPAAAFSRFVKAAGESGRIPEEKRRDGGLQFQDQFLPFLLPAILR